MKLKYLDTYLEVEIEEVIFSKIKLN